jgi:hypothetical protein
MSCLNVSFIYKTEIKILRRKKTKQALLAKCCEKVDHPWNDEQAPAQSEGVWGGGGCTNGHLSIHFLYFRKR